MLSYSRGHDAPLIDASIWDVFEKTASRFPDREALVARHQGVRLTFSELAATVERTARGLARPGDWRAGSDRSVVDELRRVGADAPGLRADRRGVGECESGVPVVRFSICAAQVEDEGAVSLGERQTVRLSRDCRRSDGGTNAGLGARGLLWHRRLGTECWRKGEMFRRAGYWPTMSPTSSTRRVPRDRRRACYLRIEIF